MLASVYSYRAMVKSVSSCCVRGSRVLSNPVTYVCVPVRLIITSGVMCCDIRRPNVIGFMAFIWQLWLVSLVGVALASIHIMETSPIRVS